MLVLGGCQTAPLTGREQIMLVDPATEAQLGEKAWAEVKAQSKPYQDQATVGRVRAVALRIAAASGIDAKWDIAVIDDDQINAFALPGGKIAVYRGILPVCADDAGLATVLAHEVGHVIARHGAERISRQQAVQAGTNLASVWLGGGAGSDPGTLGALLGLGVQYGIEMPFSREQEYEADRIGLSLMAQAGYDPRQAIAFWQRMRQAKTGGQPPEFLSDHPDDANRIAEIQRLMPEALARYKPR